MLINRFELHGDRTRGEDPQTEIGLANAGAAKCCYIRNRTGVFTAPAYGKAARLISLAERLNIPVLFLYNASALCAAPTDSGLTNAHAELMEALIGAGVPLIAAVKDERLRQFVEPIFDLLTHPEANAVEVALKHAAQWTPDEIRQRRACPRNL